jgi:hypothetical protein
MAKMSLQVDLIRALDQVNLTLKKDGATLGGMGLSAADMDDLIARLARARAAMTDIVPPRLEPGARLQATPASAWQTKRHNNPQGIILALRHPGLGWLSFLLPPESAAGLAQAIGKGLRDHDAP